jgi:tRNA threonylcarbamoyladenosine biosynthesis protein TsaE
MNVPRNLLTVYSLTSESETHSLAQAFAASSRTDDCFALKGDLGSGKTTFARAFIRALVGEDTAVSSPTFTLIQDYSAPAIDILHADLYRLETREEIDAIGLIDQMAGKISLIEWPEKIMSILPEQALVLEWQIGERENARQLHIYGVSEWKNRLPKI